MGAPFAAGIDDMDISRPSSALRSRWGQGVEGPLIASQSNPISTPTSSRLDPIFSPRCDAVVVPNTSPAFGELGSHLSALSIFTITDSPCYRRHRRKPINAHVLAWIIYHLRPVASPHRRGFRLVRRSAPVLHEAPSQHYLRHKSLVAATEAYVCARLSRKSHSGCP